jgi:RimJ/RimL family protein N-acetyltransferase
MPKSHIRLADLETGQDFEVIDDADVVRRARAAGLHMIFAHTLAAESASTSVLARCGFAPVAELIDPDEGPVWRWELRLDENGGQRA